MRFHRPFAVLTALGAVVSASSPSARETVVEDSPARLVLEIEVPDYDVVEGTGGVRVVAGGFPNPSEPGTPDFPLYRFQIATGSRMPSVSVEPLEWTDAALPRGLAGVPRWVTNRQPEAHRDPALFAAARALNPGVSGIQRYRGLELRHVTLPLGLYTEGAPRIRLLRKFRVRVDFPDPSPSPSPGARAWLERAGVKNPIGGAHLAAWPRPAGLRRAAARAQFPAGAGLLKIRVGDAQIDGFGEDGVYALTYEAAAAAGLEFGQPVGRLRLYAGPKDTLSTRLDGLAPPTLREIPVEVEDNNGNQTFDAGDRILFYGHGTSVWKPIPGAADAVRWRFGNDPWSFWNHYYLDWSGSDAGALRLGTAAAVPVSDTVAVAPHYLRAERDLATGTCDPAGLFDDETGPKFYWHGRFLCAGTSGPVTLSGSQIRSPPADTLFNRAPDSAVRFGFFTHSGQSDSAFEVMAGGGVPLPYTPFGVPGSWYSKTSGFDGNLTGLESVFWHGFFTALINARFEGYTVRYSRALDWNPRVRTVFPAVTGQRVAYRISGAPAGLRVLRIEDGVGARWLAVQQAPGAAAFSDSAGADEDVLYYLHGAAALTVSPSAVIAEPVPSQSGVIQDLSTGDGKDPEYLIIAPKALLPEAVRLRDYRDSASSPWITSVARTEDIYREWSGGRPAPAAIRDFLRWAVNRWAGGGAGRLRHVLLYGDGHYDYRDIRNGASVNPAPNHVPPFNWDFDNGNPMSTDDFYAVLDSGKQWQNGMLDLSVGRLPVATREQGANYLEKIRRYEDPATGGEWRSRMLLAADDATQRRRPGGVDPIKDHTRQAEEFGQRILQGDSGMRLERLYLFDYPHNASFLKPEATRDLIHQLNRGALLFSFYGHGAYNQLADEVLLKTGDGLSRLRNRDRAFCMAIFSCTVGRFDKLTDAGMTEQFVRQKDYGAVVGIAASRETFSGPNENLGEAFVGALFGPDTDSGGIGEVMMRAKNGNIGEVGDNRKYVLLGEPVTRLRRAGLGLELLDAAPDTLRALGCDSIRGRVTAGSGKGWVNVRIVSGDAPKTYTFPVEGGGTGSLSVKKRGQILFERTMPYEDSAFSMRYFLPKQVPFGDTAARIEVFAWDAGRALESALLVPGLPIAGTADSGSSCMEDDQRGPRIAVTGCNARESGDVDFPDRVRISLPYCLQITVTDTGGGVMAGEGPDQGTTVEVVGSIAPFHPQAGVDDLYGKTYQLSLSPQEIAEGTHLLKVSARDGFGNLGQRRITLQVAQDTALRFLRAFNAPNPMKGNGTTFWFSTTLPVEEGADLTSVNVDRIRFDIRIFNQQGYMVREFRDSPNAPVRSGEVRWDGRDAWGRMLANGVYFYQVTAAWNEENGGPQGGRRVSRKNTLVISR